MRKNRQRLKRITIAFIALLTLLNILAFHAFAINRTEPPAEPVTPSVRAMGGAYTAVALDQNAVFYNPAGYAAIEKPVTSLLTLGLRLNIDDSALDVYNAVLSGSDITSSGNITDLFGNTTVAPGITGPISFGRVGGGLGFSFYNDMNVKLITKPGAITPSANLKIYSDLGLVGGYARALPFLDNLYAGINLKVIFRVKSELEGTAVGVFDAIESSGGIPIAKAVGFGSDLGLLYLPVEWCSLGLAAKDFFGTRFSSWELLSGSGTSFEKSLIKPRIAMGAAFYPLRGGSETEKFRSLIIALEYSDLLDFTSVLSNVKMGVSLTTLKILTVRCGFEGGYFGGGLGFDLRPVNIDLVYYVDELGAYPGARPVQNLMLSFALRWQ